jgi:hypothetical protein
LSQPEAAAERDLRDLYGLLSKAYDLGGQSEKALAIAAEREKLG